MLSIFAVIAAVQFFLSAVVVLSVPHAVHIALQPFMAQLALRVREARLPAWFSTGRLGRATAGFIR